MFKRIKINFNSFPGMIILLIMDYKYINIKTERKIL